jgi:molybdopterin-synthase adenylyltransferase
VVSLQLSEAEHERYSCQLSQPELGPAAQARLKSSRVLVVGAGALGSPVAAYLVAAGVGSLGIVDPDEVKLSDLHRLLVHYTPDCGQNKAESAAAKLGFLNPETQVDSYPANVEPENARAMIAGNDLVVDCTNRRAVRHLINEACVKLGTALVEGGACGFSGWVTSIRPGESACYRCIDPDSESGGLLEPSEQASALGPVAGIVGSLQALEALKLLTGAGEPLTDRVLRIDGLSQTIGYVVTARSGDCAACGAVGSTLEAAL